MAAGAVADIVDTLDRDPVTLSNAVRALRYSWDRAFTQLLGRYTRLMQGRPPAAARLRHAG